MKSLDTTILALALCVLDVAAVPTAERINVLKARDDARLPCGPHIPSWPLSPFNWNAAKVDENLKIWRQGGKDTEGTVWTPLTKTANQQFTSQMGVQMLNTAAWNCSIETPCDADIINCQRVGLYTVPLSNSGFKRSKWGYFALNALVNLNARFSNVYQSLQDAEADLANLQLDLGSKFGKKKSDSLDIQEALSGLSSVFGVVGGFLGPAAPLVGGIGGTLGAVGGGIGFASGSSPIANPAEYGKFIADFSSWLRTQIDHTAGDLFKGAKVGGYTIEDALAGGAWVSRDTTPQASTSTNLKLELMSRGINALWKKSKIFVTYVDLKDDMTGTRCKADRSGPQITKFCDDGGVYYLYRFDERGYHKGALDKPWGMNDLESVGLDPAWVTESSARSYRASKNGYDFDQKTGAQAILAAAGKSGIAQFNNKAGRLPGTWTIPVCDMGTYAKWNQDYLTDTNQPNIDDDKYTSPLPCICGPGGSRTAAFAKAAQMDGFDTLLDWCYAQTRSVEWPQGVEKIEYGFGSVKRP